MDPGERPGNLMGHTAYIFPGQGSQYVGMAREFAEKIPEARAVIEQADRILGFPLSRVCFEGPEEELRQTRNTQPAIFLHSIVSARALQSTAPAQMVAGHSLGEYSALVVAGALGFEDGLRLVRLRGELMQRAGESRRGTMAAIVGLPAEELTDLCTEASRGGIVQPANFNSPGQTVISGSLDGVHRAMELARERGAKLVKELVVSGAFHSALMEEAREGLTVALEKTTINNARIPVYANGQQVGYATSGCWSPTLKKYLALAHIQAKHGSPGDRVEIEVTAEHQRKRARARVARTPFFDPERKRA